MKNAFKYFFIIWLVAILFFNAITVAGLFYFGIEANASFWIAFAFANGSFIFELWITYSVLGNKSAQKIFYNLPLLKELPIMKKSYITISAMFLTSAICMWVSFIPKILVIIFCIIEIAADLIYLIKTKAFATFLSDKDEEIKEKTFFIKSLTVDADTLLKSADSDTKEICKKVYEAIRYSDPMSNTALSGVESEISLRFHALLEAVKTNDSESAKKSADELLILISDRNSKCKLLK